MTDTSDQTDPVDPPAQERQPERVAVVVFCEVTDGDPQQAAVLAVRKALQGGEQLNVLPRQLDPVVLYRGQKNEQALPPVTVHQVTEAGVAAGNGLLWMRPTAKAYTG